MKTIDDVRSGTCRFCGEHIVLSFNAQGWAYYHAPERSVTPTAVNGTRAIKSECLNAAGYLTQHDPE